MIQNENISYQGPIEFIDILDKILNYFIIQKKLFSYFETDFEFAFVLTELLMQDQEQAMNRLQEFIKGIVDSNKKINTNDE